MFHDSHPKVPNDYRASSTSAKLDEWIRTQKKRYKKNELPKFKIRLIEAVGLDLDAAKKRNRDWYFEEKFENKCNSLLKYR